MSKEIISSRQGVLIILMHFIGSLVMVGTDISAKQNVWISVILSLAMSLPVLLIYSKLLTLYPGKNLFDIAIEIFGNIFGKAIALLFILYSFHLGCLVIRNFSEYINVVSLPETPQPISIYFLGLLCIWMCKAGIEVLGRWVSLITPILLFILAVAIILSLTEAHYINLLPVMYDGVKPILITSFSFLAFPFLEVVVVTMLFDSFKHGSKAFRAFFISAAIGSLIMVLVLVRNVLVLGSENINQVFFPSMLAVKTINIGVFLQRIEVAVSIVFIFGAFVKISICLMAASVGTAKVFNLDSSKYLVAPLGFLMMSMASILYGNIMEMFDWASNIYQYYALPFQIIIPAVILISAQIKIKVQSKKHKAAAGK
ncbi:spore germination protein KB [Ruminiclostridium sufflavum DSM 19573]|uniref:Spore germination protein KB n=1 Tax=Ruminiclostridium sufflavum DSM 19573 TaxID=1121337 RepID=A0A318XY48_9FIRM|nr:endospore germination permease [Ruminiclostridium sufflavum]PYG87773.1 spore germination protein KB [Ruminiclostridium sufflavum DSM 19573]